jgi:hypothetical protein
MPIIVEPPKPSNYTLPAEGVHAATVKALKDLGTVSSAFGPKEKVLLTFTIDDELNLDGEGDILVFRRYTRSLHPKAPLSEAVTALMGGTVTGRFDLETLVGRKCKLWITHNKPADGTRTFANVVKVTKP